jgi:hypothetical protein
MEAGEDNKDTLVRRIHTGLDPSLRAAVMLRLYHNELEHFREKVFLIECATRDN